MFRGAPTATFELVDDDDENRASETVELSELQAIEAAALIAKKNKALTFMAPPDLVLRLARSHHATSVGALLSDVTARDVLSDLADRVESLRTALRAIKELREQRPEVDVREALLRAVTVATKALRLDDLSDQSMRGEHGFGISEVYKYPVADDDYATMPDPKAGEVWRDAFGAEYRVAEVDAKNFTARLELVHAAEWIETAELATHGQRVDPPTPEAHGAENGSSVTPSWLDDDN